MQCYSYLKAMAWCSALITTYCSSPNTDVNNSQERMWDVFTKEVFLAILKILCT